MNTDASGNFSHYNSIFYFSKRALFQKQIISVDFCRLIILCTQLAVGLVTINLVNSRMHVFTICSDFNAYVLISSIFKNT